MANKKKVLIITQHYWPENFRITDIAEGMAEKGYLVDVLCGIPNYPTGKYFRGYGLKSNRRQLRKGVNIIRVPEIPRFLNNNLGIILNYISFPFFCIFSIIPLLSKKYDRVFSYQLSPVFMTLPAIVYSKLTKVPLYIYVCDFWPHQLFSVKKITNTFLRKILTFISYWHYKNAQGVIATFEGIKKQLESDAKIPIHKTIYIPQAPEKLYEKNIYDKTLNKRFSDTFNIVFAGSLNPAQSFDTLIKAAEIVNNELKIKIKYVIVGDGMSRKSIENEIKRLKLTNIFEFEGTKKVEDIPKYHYIADALIVALLKSDIYEYAIPAKVNSYMASGKPILGAMDGEAKTLINTKAKCGICVSSGDYKELAKAIIKIVKMKKHSRDSLGRNGKLYYNKYFERDMNLNRLIDFVF